MALPKESPPVFPRRRNTDRTPEEILSHLRQLHEQILAERNGKPLDVDALLRELREGR